MTDSTRIGWSVLIVIVMLGLLSVLFARTLAGTDAGKSEAFHRSLGITDAWIAQAFAWQALWLNTTELRNGALADFKRGKLDAALAGSARAAREARLAVNQAQLEAARYFHSRHLASASSEQRRRHAALAAMLAAHDGAAAYALARRLGAKDLR